LCSEIEKDLHFIGVAPNRESEITLSATEILSSITLDNLTVHIESDIEIGRGILSQSDEHHGSSKCTLTMTNCNIRYSGSRIMVPQKSSLNLNNCVLQQKGTWREDRGRWAIVTSPRANEVNMCDCSINGFDRVMVIQKGRRENELEDLVQIKITDNIFEGISEYAVVESTRSGTQPNIKGTDKCILFGNTCTAQSLQPNTLLHVDE